MSLETKVGLSGFDDHRFRGRALFAELTGRPFSALLALAIDGKLRTDEESAMLDDLAAVVALADPRIWPVKLVRVASAHGGALAGIAASLMATEDARIGAWTSQGSAEVLEAVRASEGSTADALSTQLAKRRVIPGFGVAARRKDERVAALTDRIHRRGRAELPYWRLTQELIALMRSERGVEPNISIVFAAACLDLGFAAHHVGVLATSLWLLVPIANAAEGAEQAPAILQSLPLEAIDYRGAPPRKSSR